MKPDAGDDTLARLLSGLSVASPDATRSARVRARCHEALALRASHSCLRTPRSAKLLMTLCALYATELTRLIVAFYRTTL